MTFYPARYYKSIKSSTTQYSRTPQGGGPNIQRMINNQPYWRTTSESNSQSHKVLIFANWACLNASLDHIQKILNQLHTLDKDGFKLYLLQNTCLEVFSKADFHKLLLPSTIPSIKILPHDKIKQMAFEQHQLPHDDVLILDYYEFECLEAQKDVPRRLSINSLLPFKDYFPDLISILNTFKPAISEILSDNLSKDAFSIWDQLEDIFPEIPIIINYHSLSDTAGNILHDIYQITSPSELAGLHKISITSCDDLNNIEYLLSNATNIRELDLIRNFHLNTINWENFSLSQLNELHVDHGNISPKQLKSILKQTTKLQSLTLIDSICPLQDIEFEKLELNTLLLLELSMISYIGDSGINNIGWKNIALNSLYTLYLHHTNISEENLFAILNNAPNLNHLVVTEQMPPKVLSTTVHDCVNKSAMHFLWEHLQLQSDNEYKTSSTYPENLPLNKMPHLKIINIERSSICTHTKALLILQAGMLQIINEFIYNELNKNQYINYKKVNFTHITHINLPHVLHLNHKLINHIFQQAKQLEFLNIANYQPDNNDYKFKRLTSLTLENVKNMSDLQKIISMAPRLNYFNMRDQNLDHLTDTDWQSIYLPLLRTMELTSTNMPSKNLLRFLQQMPNIEYLNLQKRNGLAEYSWEEINFPHIKQLHLTHVDINGESLRRLLGRIPSLEELYLFNCNNLNDYRWQPFETMPLLEKIDIFSSNIPPKLLQQLIDQCPNIKIIEIQNCPLLRNSEFFAFIPEEGTYADTAQDPVYDPQNQFNEKTIPSPESFHFTYSGINKTLNQSMVIEKLSQYMVLTNQNMHHLYKIQEGICQALSIYFLHNKQLLQILNHFNQWDGRLETLTPRLHQEFQTLWQYVCQYQLSNNLEKTYLGDNLLSFLNINQKNMLLFNAKHAIALRFIQNSWFIYDPNFVNGPKKFNTTEQLLIQIHQSIGTLVAASSNFSSTNPEIKNPQIFIELGGLALMPQVVNTEEILRKHVFLWPELSNTALNGLFARNAQEIPAWATGLADYRTKPLIQNLLYQFIKKEPYYKEQLMDSIRLLGSKLQKYYLNLLADIGYSISDHDTNHYLHELFPTFPDLSNMEYELKEEKEEKKSEKFNQYTSMLETWRAPAPPFQSLNDYLAYVIHHNKIAKKHLIELTSAQEIVSLQLLLLEYCLNNAYPVYCINSPDDLVCSASYIQRQGTIGITRKGPGGPLYDFLIQNKNSSLPPVLLINFDEFKASDRVNHNNLLDTHRKADGVLLPPHTLIIGLNNSFKSEAYQGSDFNSRFDLKESCPLPLPPLPEIPQYDGTHMNYEIINLGNAADWKERLLGRWIIQKQQISFEKGALEAAVKTGNPLQVHNAPWENMQFLSFWHQARVTGDIPVTLPCYKSSGTLFTLVHQGNEMRTGFKPSALTLNPGTLDSFFKTYVCDNSKKTLDIFPGILPQNAGKTVEVNITRELSEEDWGFIIESCNKYSIRLNTYYAPPHQEIAWQPNLRVIHSNDPQISIQHVMHEDIDWVVIPITECTAASLISTIDGDFSQQTMSFTFQQVDGILRKAIDAKKKIILHGAFSQELMDHLAPLLLSEPLKQPLILISHSEKHFNYLPLETHQINTEDKWQYLHKKIHMTEEEWNILHPFAHESSNKLCARLRYVRALGSTDAWQGLTHSTAHYDLNELDLEHSKKQAQAFTQGRIEAIDAILNQGPFVFLSGPTAVGKSTFVIDEYAAQEHIILFPSEEHMERWAQTQSQSQCLVLFLDEANMSSRQWSEFEGLFHPKPNIIIHGKYYELSPRHKIIFAGNPLSYGGERQLASLFEQHGNALEFKPMPLAFIYEKLLKPAVINTPFEHDLPAIAAPILNVYRFICKHSHKDILISPRELQMILLMTLSFSRKNPNDCAKAAAYYAFELAYPLVPMLQKEEFRNKFWQGLPQIQKISDTYCQPSRLAVKQQLNDLLDLRMFRREADHKIHQYGGLGGIILEGDVGIGKSELVLSVLEHQGYIECVQYSGTPQTDQDKLFYHMPVSMQLDEKKELLLKAFHEGAVVIVDEINSSPMMEGLLNDLLMGKAPGKIPPLRPGFLLIGTQNPPAPGKSVPTTALSRRLIHRSVSPYTDDEMIHILSKIPLSNSNARALVTLYKTKKNEAYTNCLTPEPTFRDLIRVAKKCANDLNTVTTQHFGFFQEQKRGKPAEDEEANTSRKRAHIT